MSVLEDLDGAIGDGETPPKETKEVKEVEDIEEVEVPEKKKEDKGAEEDDLEDDDDDLEDDDEDESAPKKVPKEPSRITAINKDFPELFKKYPDLKAAWFKHQDFAQVFATPEAASEAAEKSELLDKLSNDLLTGNHESLLDLLHETDPEALKLHVRNFLPTLNKKSPALFTYAVTPVIRNLFAKIGMKAEADGDEQLALAVKYMNKAVFDKAEIPSAEKVEPVLKKNEELQAERDSLSSQRESLFYQNCIDLADPIVDRFINDGLDPDNVLSEGLREDTIEKIRIRVYQKLQNNSSHMRTMLAMRKSAAANGYNKEWQKKIAKAVTNAAKEIIPAVRTKVKQRLFGKMFDGKLSDTTTAIPNSDGSPATIGGNKGAEVKPDLKNKSIREALDGVI